MIPDFERRLNEKMDQASLKELMPGFDEEVVWQLLLQKMRPAKRRLSMPVWSYAAAILVLLSVACLTWYLSGNNIAGLVKQGKVPPHSETILPVVKDSSAAEKGSPTDPESRQVTAAVRKPVSQRGASNASHKYVVNDIIYNGTPCPIELRISQMMKCPNHKPEAISSSSTLEPDQSGQLNYKDTNTVAKNCSLTIKEIEIKSIATGEIILLNSKSLPSTAQEVFSYITREKKGDVLAGMFNFDCDNKTRKHNLRIDNREGNLILE